MDSELQTGDQVYAARKRKGSHMLSTACHEATVLAVTPSNNRGKRLITVQYAEDRGPLYTQVDSINFVLAGTKGMAATIIPREATVADENEVAQMSVAEAAVPVATLGAEADAPPIVPLPATGLVGAMSVPAKFGSMNAAEVLGVDIPSHILSRWRVIDTKMRVQELFGTVPRAAIALKGVKILSLSEFTGESSYNRVPVRTGSKVRPGLIELFASEKIKGRTTRARTKGLMFFFLACREPNQVRFPSFQPNPEDDEARIEPFSLSEQARLASLMADPDNVQVVSMLMKKWTRADLDAAAGAKGIAHYWDKIAVMFNDIKYVPIVSNEFVDYVETLGDGYSCRTDLVPEYRSGDVLRTQWSKLRRVYALFHSKYERSGMNEPDPCKYSTDLPTLLMHWTFYETSMGAWAAKSCDESQVVDDAGDGSSASAGGDRKRMRIQSKKTSSDMNECILAGAAMYDSLHGVNIKDLAHDPEEVQRHNERVRRIGRMTDSLLDLWEKNFA